MHTIVMDQGMLVSGIILAASFILIFTETLHGFHRVKVAMAGAAVMLVVGQSYGFYSPEAAFEGNYFWARPLFIYIAESAKGMSAVREFVDFYFVAMDAIVPAVGYVPMLAEQKMASLMSWSAFSRG